MKVTVCDVCDEKYGPEDPMISMVVPSYFIDDQIGPEALNLDVCSWECVDRISRGAHETATSSSQPEEQPEQPEKFIAVPQSPTIKDMDEKELAKFTEQVTGVKRR